MTHITDFPDEILTIIGQNFQRSTLISTVLTCRRFYRLFISRLWEEVIVKEAKHSIPTCRTLKNHASFVHSLCYEGNLLEDYYRIHYPNLVSIDIEAFPSLIPVTERNFLWADFLALNPTIRDIDISIHKSAFRMDFWNAISNSLHNPRRLVFKTFIRVYQEDVEAFWKACSRFEEIDYDGSEQWIHDGFKDQYFPRLKRLHYSTSDGTMSTLLKWLPNCRNLKDLKCITRIEPIEVQSFANIVKETWPFMESLELGSTSGTDEVFAILMRSLPALKNWGLGGGSFGLEAFTQLRNRHFDTLTTLRMANIDLFSSEMVLEVLTSCMQLERLEAYCISIRNFNSSCKPWICRRLRYLKVPFVTNKDDVVADRLLFEQLSMLEQLEEIDVSRPYGRMTVSPAPQWRLDHGLSQLKTLKRLRRFACDNNHLDMGFKDVQWILDHWPSLKIFTGTVAQYPIDQDAITKLVRERLRLK